MRVLLGIVGGSSLLAGALVAVNELRWIARGAALLPAVVVAAFALLVAASGAYVMRGAVRGHIVVRRTGVRGG